MTKLQHTICEDCGNKLIDHLTKKYEVYSLEIGVPYIKCKNCLKTNKTGKIRYKELALNRKISLWKRVIISTIISQAKTPFIIIVVLLAVLLLAGVTNLSLDDFLIVILISLVFSLYFLILSIRGAIGSMIDYIFDVEKNHERRMKRRKIKEMYKSGKLKRRRH